MKRRRWLRWFITVAVFICVVKVIAQRPPSNDWPLRGEQPAEGNVALLISFGHKDQEPRAFDGQMKLSAGRILRVRGWRFQQQDKILSTGVWQFSTRVGPFNVLTEPLPEPGAPPQRRLIPNGVVVTLDAPPSATVDVSTQAGSFRFDLSQVPFDKPLSMLEGNALVERLIPGAKLTNDHLQNDYPSAIVAKDGSLWVAWVAYENEADRVMVARRTASGWSEATPTSERPGDYFKTAIAQDARGRIWVVWSSQLKGNWDLYARSFDGSKWSATQRLTTDPAPDLFHRLVADSQGQLYLVWQGFRGGQSDILLKTFDGQKWSAEIQVSDSRANDWEPAIASDHQGTIYVAWDSYERGNYDIFLRRYSRGTLGPIVPIATSPRFEARADVACDRQGRAWIAWEEAGVNWGKDVGNLIRSPGTTLYYSRRLRVACLEGDRLRETEDDVMQAVPDQWRRYAQLPQLFCEPGGRLWALFRVRTYTQNTRTDNWANLGRWEIFATYHDGHRWQPAVLLQDSVGRVDMPVALASDPANHQLWCAWISDERPFAGGGPGRPYGVPYVGKHNLYYTGIPVSGQSAPLPLTSYRAPSDTASSSGHSNEAADVARVRAFTYKIDKRTYRIFRGDLHRHTDISVDGAGDGSLIDLYRYALDAAKLDYILVGDHNSGNDDEYSWWRTQKSNDLFYLPGHFVPLYGYERSVNYPNGHRNVAFARRGVRTLPISAEENNGKVNSGPIVYPYLRQNGGVGTSHSLATSQGTDWRDNDPELEPIAELYQGYHASYEYEGAPRAESPGKLRVIHGRYQPEGFIWNAWAKGLKLGVQSSSDHISTHVSYACLLSEAFTREGLIEAMKKRHSYAATDNLIIDFRARDAAGDHLMGDIYMGHSAPKLIVKIIGTADVQQVDVIKNNKFVYNLSPKNKEVDFTYQDNNVEDGTSYYYVRVLQADDQMLWSSPIWVTKAK